MPTYDYKCECGNEQEIFFRSIKEMEEAEKGTIKQTPETGPVVDPLECPKCYKRMKKQITSFSFELKGGDFPSKKFKRPFG